MRHTPPYPEGLARVPLGPSTREERAAWVAGRHTFRRAWEAEQRADPSLCQYSEPWRGPCWAPLPCEHHTGKMCSTCKEAPALRGCDHTGMLVCGNPLCADCRCRRHR